MKLRLRKIKKNDSAILSFFLAFILLGSMLVFLFAVGIPFSIDFSVAMYGAGEDIIENAQSKIEDIDDRLDSLEQRKHDLKELLERTALWDELYEAAWEAWKTKYPEIWK